jgi:hypothetical protein
MLGMVGSMDMMSGGMGMMGGGTGMMSGGMMQPDMLVQQQMLH